MVEKMRKLFLSHANTCISNADFHITVGCGGTYSDLPSPFRELTGIVGQRVEHEEGQYAVGLDNGISRSNNQLYAFQRERHLTSGDDIEELLQLEAFYLQAQLSLSQLYPMCQHVILLINLVCQLTYILQALATSRTLVVVRSILLFLKRFHLVDYAVNERHDGIDQRA